MNMSKQYRVFDYYFHQGKRLVKTVQKEKVIDADDDMEVKYAGYVCVPKKDLLSVSLPKDHNWQNHLALEPWFRTLCSHWVGMAKVFCAGMRVAYCSIRDPSLDSTLVSIFFNAKSTSDLSHWGVDLHEFGRPWASIYVWESAHQFLRWTWWTCCLASGVWDSRLQAQACTFLI